LKAISAERKKKQYISFEIFTAVSVKFALFWDMPQCNFIDGYQPFRGT